MVRRIVDALGGSARDRAENLQWIEDEAAEFVNRYWKQITRLADAILRHGSRLNEQQIRSVLSRASAVKLNQAGADYASSLVAAGKISWAPFTWNDETDAAEEYSLGADADGTEPKYHYPFGRDGEVYIQALLDAQKEGGLVADYATKLLTDITQMKAQAKADTPNPLGEHGAACRVQLAFCLSDRAWFVLRRPARSGPNPEFASGARSCRAGLRHRPAAR
jgi:hypothetical protein